MMISYEDMCNLSDADFYELYSCLEDAKKEREIIPLIDNLKTVWEKLENKGCTISYLNKKVLSFNELDFDW